MSCIFFGDGERGVMDANDACTVSPLSILKNPMILMAGVAMLMMFGMPKLMENSTTPSFLFPMTNPLILHLLPEDHD